MLISPLSMYCMLVYCTVSQSITYSSTTNNQSAHSPYYISANRFDFNNAELFCRVRCNSELSSIHNERDYQQSLIIIHNSITVFPQNEDVWSGLNDIETEGIYKYVDKTNSNFSGSFPWKSGSPNNANPWNGFGGQDCIEFSHAFNYLLDDTECNNLDRILCNHCDSVINKYVIVNQALYYDEAEAFCSDQIGTNLASIHSFDDHNEALFLCQRYDYQCWFGLHLSNGLFEWNDGTQFDYGDDVALGTYPWNIYQPNTTYRHHSITSIDAQYGTALSGDSWSIFPKNDKRYFLCSLPSELCADENRWNILQNYDDARYWRWNECELEINSFGVHHDIGILADKQWINSNSELIIEYMFKITEMYTENDENTFSSGLLLFNFDSICNYYEIGILSLNANKYNVYVGKWMNGVYHLLQTKPIDDEFGTYYVLRIVVIHKYKLGVYVNGKQYLDVTDKHRLRQNQVNNTFISGYIGLINNNFKITAKSLYISGSAIAASSVMDINATESLQLIEECEAMIQLQHMLNDDIEYKVEYGVITSIVIHVESKQLNALNVANAKFNNILSNITNDILNESIASIDKNCVFENEISIEPIEDNNTLRINITIFVCKKQTQSILTVEFNQNLERDFIQKVNDESEENEVLLSVNTEEIEVQVANTERIILITPSSTVDSTENDIANFMDLLLKHTMWIIITVVAICSFGIILLIFCRKCYQWYCTKESTKSDEIGGATNHSTPIMQLKTESTEMDLSTDEEHVPLNWNASHKKRELLIVRYPGDDDKFQLYQERFIEKKESSLDDNDYTGPIFRGPGFSVSEKRVVHRMSDNEFVIESDSEHKVTAK